MTKRRLLLLAALLTAGAAFLFFRDSAGPYGREHKSTSDRAPASVPLLEGAGMPDASGTAPVESPEPEVSQPAEEPRLPGDDWIDVRGRVTNAAGDPMVGVDVYLSGPSSDNEETDADGRFHVTCSRAGEHVLEAKLSGAFNGRARATVDASPGTSPEEVHLVFPAEGTVHGRAVYPDGRPATGIALVLHSAIHAEPPSVWSARVWSTFDGRSCVETHTDEAGTFGFGGLHPRSSYALWWLDDYDVARRHPADVAPRGGDLRVVVSRHRVRVEVLDARTGSGVDARVDIVDRSRLPPPDGERFEEAGEYWWHEAGRRAPAGTQLVIRAWSRGYALATVEHVVAPTLGEQLVRIPLLRLVGAPLLEVRCFDPEGKPLTDIPLRFHVPGTDLEIKPRLTKRIGALETRDFGPGAVRITTGPGVGTPYEDALRFFLPGAVEIELPNAGTATAQVHLQLGGAFRLTFRDESNLTPHLLDSVLRTEEGLVLPERWFYRRGKVINGGGTLSTEFGPESAALPAGRYTLSMTPAFEVRAFKPVTVEIDIEPGKLTEVEIRLEVADSKR